MAVHPAYCTLCGRHESEAGRISARGKCARCQEVVQRLNSAQMRDRSGPFYERWVKRWARAAADELERVDAGAGS